MVSVDLIYDAIAVVTKGAQAQALQVLTFVSQYVAAHSGTSAQGSVTDSRFFNMYADFRHPLPKLSFWQESVRRVARTLRRGRYIDLLDILKLDESLTFIAVPLLTEPYRGHGIA